MDLIQVGATWLHLLATVALLGFYGILGIVVVPVLERGRPAAEAAEVVRGLEARALPAIVASLVVFFVTGVWLLLTDERYGGLGDIGSTWATVFLVKHAVILGMVGVGAWIDLLAVRGPVSADPAGQLRRLRRAAAVMTILGALVLLLTAAGQAS